MTTAAAGTNFIAVRHGVIMRPLDGDAREAGGVLNPGGVRARDGTMHLFPRLVSEDNVSRIGHVRVRYRDGTPIGIERLGLALEPQEAYELSRSEGGVEDPRVVYVALLDRYVMTYTAYVTGRPRVALAISNDLYAWERLGLLEFEVASGELDLNACGNKDAAMFGEVVLDPLGEPSLAILHRPATPAGAGGAGPCSDSVSEYVWISYVPVSALEASVANLKVVRRHERVMSPEQSWESGKVGAGAPPVRFPYGWLMPYHAVHLRDGHPNYSMGVAILDLHRPSRVLYRTQNPILTPETDYERSGTIANVIFPTAADLRDDGNIDVFYGAADRVIAAVRLDIKSP